MKKYRCAECGNKLGLGVRFRNLWNGMTCTCAFAVRTVRLRMSLCVETPADTIGGFRIPVVIGLKAGALNSVCGWQ